MKKYSLLIFTAILSCSGPKSFEQVRIDHPSSFVEVTDRHHELIHETRVDFKRHRRNWTPLSDLPPEFITEILAAEDKRFFSHHGFDPLAFFGSIKDWPKRGASTITMQLSGMLKGEKGRRNFLSKISQIKDALVLETSWSKNQILETWLNLITFKGEIQGIRAASLALFSKDPRGLNSAERMLLLGSIPSPNQSEDKLMQRACRYYRSAHADRKCDDLTEALANSNFKKPKTELTETNAPHVATKLRGTPSNLIVTSLIKNLQLETERTLASHIKNLRIHNVRDGAVLILDRKTAEVLAYVGSTGRMSASPQVDHIQSRRQAGSTLKPLLYASAISHRLMTMTTPLKDEPFAVTREGLTYQPENYQKGFTYQDVPAKIALGSSLNIPAVRVIDYVGPERFYNLLTELEFRDLQDSEFYGHSMALGSVDVTLWDLTRSYRTLAEGGSFIEPTFFTGLMPEKQISELNPEVSFIISHILSEKNNRHLTFGIQSTLSTDSWSAVKTGTSKDMRDNWCVGYTDSYVIGVWVGNSSGEPMWNVTGISGAAPIFSHMVSYLHQKKASVAPTAPSKLIRINDDYYLPGTEPKSDESLLLSSTSVASILFPQNGSQFAYDPEIPLKNQKVLFQSSRDGLHWKLNGRELSETEIKDGFSPTKQGKFNLELWDEKQKRDEVSFYVKTGKI